MYFAECQIEFSLGFLSVDDRYLKQELVAFDAASISCLKCGNLGHVIKKYGSSSTSLLV